jgi:cytochrome c
MDSRQRFFFQNGIIFMIMTKNFLRKLALLALVLAAFQIHAQESDISKGKDLFATNCVECHSLKEGRNKKGPSLFHIYGNKAALKADYEYSAALRHSWIIWNADSLSKYLANPKKFVPGGKMKFDGIAEEDNRRYLIEFLVSISKK